MKTIPWDVKLNLVYSLEDQKKYFNEKNNQIYARCLHNKKNVSIR